MVVKKIVGIEEKRIEVGGLEWYYLEGNPESETDKPPVVLLHGIPAVSFCWTEVMPELTQQGFRAIAPDWIGCGLSAKPNKSDFAYTPDAFVEALDGFVTHLNLDRFHLVVQGFLGSVGLQFALRHPEKVLRLAILNAPVTPKAKLPWKIQQLGLPLVGDMMTQDPLLVDRTLETGSGYTISEQDLDMYRRPFLKSSAAGRSLLTIIRNLQLKSAMEEIASSFPEWSQPTLVLWGTRDPWLPIDDAKAFAQTLEDGEFIAIEEAGHYPQEHWSEPVIEALVPFLRRMAV
jgi:pimeloyl-ACP methyl ester carboxylesterase